MALHFRRRDYLRSRHNKVPSLKWAAEQVKKKLKEHALDVLFVATDAPQEEFQELQAHLPEYKVVRYQPPKDIHVRFKDGGVAIIDQLICSSARWVGNSLELE